MTDLLHYTTGLGAGWLMATHFDWGIETLGLTVALLILLDVALRFAEVWL